MPRSFTPLDSISPLPPYRKLQDPGSLWKIWRVQCSSILQTVPWIQVLAEQRLVTSTRDAQIGGGHGLP